MGTCKFTAEGNPAMDKHPTQGGVEILHATETGISSGTDGPLGSYADFTYLLHALLDFMMSVCILSRLRVFVILDGWGWGGYSNKECF